MYIPRSVIKKILKEAGAERMSEEAVSIFHNNINKIAFTMASRSVKLAKHAKRKTISSSDIKLAVQTAEA